MRPRFEDIPSSAEFKQYFWYKTELQHICKTLGIDPAGSKPELEKRLITYLDFGKTKLEPSATKKSIRYRKVPPTKITLETKILLEGVRFNKQFRDFLQAYYNVSKFRFNREMREAIREVEHIGNTDFTVKDLLTIYEHSKKQQKITKDKRREDITCPWNLFVKDFMADESSKQFKQKIKVAAFLWRVVRDRKGEKTFNPDLIRIHHKKLIAIDS